MREFLTFFLKKKTEIINKVEELRKPSGVEPRGISTEKKESSGVLLNKSFEHQQ